MRKHLKKIIALICCFTLSLGAFASLTACSSKEAKSYEIVYNLNYEGETARTVTVPSGATVVDWQPDREGYSLIGWYTNADCTRKYNFSKKIGADLNLYAKWSKNADTVIVTFDGNYRGKYANTAAAVKVGDFIDETLAPQVNRLGYEFTGWYKDAECLTEFDFNTRVSEDVTLYAGYKRDNSVQRDNEGNPIFNNITVNVWLADGFSNNDNVMWNLAKAFNKDPRYKGKITVNVNKNLTSQDFFSLRFQKTTEKNETDDMYYSVDEIYNLANIEYSDSDWYEQASRECRVAGRLSSVPIVAGVPYLLYNKALMAKYNGENEMPTNYTEFSALLKKAYEGERNGNANFKSIVTCKDWPYTDVTSYAAFIQNDTDFYEYENGAYVNKWDEGSNDGVVTALTNTYNMFGTYGENNGLLGPSEWLDDTARQRVISGNSLMGIVNYPQTIIDLCERNDVGVLPLSGLFADEGEHANQIPVYTLGLSFYRAGGLSNTELAAAGVFADYVSKNSYLFAQNGWYPMNKSVVESNKFQNSDNPLVAFLRKVGNPENFRTMDGHINSYLYIRDIAAKQYILPVLQSNGKDIAERSVNMTASMKSI